LTHKHDDKYTQRNKIMNEVREAALSRMGDLSAHERYDVFVRALIVEALIEMLEDAPIAVRCRAQDTAVVTAQVAPAVEEYVAMIKEATGVTVAVNISVNETKPLPPGPEVEGPGKKCRGGIILSSRGGKIVCDNTVENRLGKAFHSLTPTLRSMLFPEEDDASAEEKSATI
jgi:vacuolar-type H+-ATPase subunit E/Vma4